MVVYIPFFTNVSDDTYEILLQNSKLSSGNADGTLIDFKFENGNLIPLDVMASFGDVLLTDADVEDIFDDFERCYGTMDCAYIPAKEFYRIEKVKEKNNGKES